MTSFMSNVGTMMGYQLAGKAIEGLSQYMGSGQGGVMDKNASVRVEMPTQNQGSNSIPVINPNTGINRILVNNHVASYQPNAPFGYYPQIVNVGGMPQTIASVQPMSSPYANVESVIRNIHNVSAAGILNPGSRTNPEIYLKKEKVEKLKAKGAALNKKKQKSSIFVVKKKQ